MVKASVTWSPPDRTRSVGDQPGPAGGSASPTLKWWTMASGSAGAGPGPGGKGCRAGGRRVMRIPARLYSAALRETARREGRSAWKAMATRFHELIRPMVKTRSAISRPEKTARARA